jgi:hypothetical protein
MPEPHLRASDADRAAVADVLGTHMSAGRLTVTEYDDRLARAYAARTYGDLAPLTADLPAIDRPRVDEPARGCAGPAYGWTGWGPWAGAGGLRAAWGSWLTTAVIVVGIWALSSIASTGWIHPWPLWVIGPWGIVLLARSLGGKGSRERTRDRRSTAYRDR